MKSTLTASILTTGLLLISSLQAGQKDWLQFIENRCLDCHDSDTAKGEVVLDALNPDLSDQATAHLWNRVLDQVAFREMPPKDKKQPKGEEREAFVASLEAALTKAGNLPDLQRKMLQPEYANYVEHKVLFDGSIQTPPYTPSRLWLKSPFTFDRLINDGAGITNPGRYGKRPTAFSSGSILRATADAEIARLFPAPFQHVGLALRGKVMGKEWEGTLYPGITAVAPNRALPFQASPDIAHQQLFDSAVANSELARTRNGLQGKLLDFMVDDISKLERTLPSTEREKMGHYLNAFEELQTRRQKLSTISDEIRAAAPEMDPRFTSKTPEDRQAAHFDLISAALISGITNVVTMRLDNISTNYPTLGLTEKNVHGIGHKEDCNGKSPEEARDLIRVHHMKLLADLAGKLKSIPEGDGTMLDNTTILYFSDSGNEHHGNLSEWPYLILGGSGGRMKLAGRYIRYPKYGSDGHRTIGNWWTTWLNAFGNPTEHYGNFDLDLQKNGVPQKGALTELMV